MLIASTSIEAFHAHVVTGKASAQQARILSFIAARGGDWSIGELAKVLIPLKSGQGYYGVFCDGR